MSVDTQTQAILLLTAHLQKASHADVKPLTAGEWGRFAGWLHAEGKRPEELLKVDSASVLHGWHDRDVSHERLLKLLEEKRHWASFLRSGSEPVYGSSRVHMRTIRPGSSGDWGRTLHRF